MPVTKPTVQAPARPQRQLRWGDRGVSEQMIVQDVATTPSPQQTRLRLEETGILSELQHHVYGTATINHGTGTNAKDPFGPFPVISQYTLSAGSNTPLISLSGIALGLLQDLEYPDRSFQSNTFTADVMQPLPDFTNVFNHPAATGTLRFWARIPVALRWLGMPGGAVGHLILQNKKISNVVAINYNLSGGASPYNAAPNATVGNGAYEITGNDTVTFAGTNETWKTLNTVPDARSKMPVFGFTRYISEIVQPYSGTSFKYILEPGGLLLRAALMFLDGGTTPVTESQISNIIFSYGTNKQIDQYTPYRNRMRQLDVYGRQLPAGTYVLDYYTKQRNTVDAKSTENTANVQFQAAMAAGYTPAANSVVRILLDKVYIVQNRLA